MEIRSLGVRPSPTFNFCTEICQGIEFGLSLNTLRIYPKITNQHSWSLQIRSAHLKVMGEEGEVRRYH